MSCLYASRTKAVVIAARQFLNVSEETPPDAERMEAHPLIRAKKYVLWPCVAAFVVPLTGCSGGSQDLPDSLYATWTGGNDTVSSVRFSDGGRVEINGGQCSGEYAMSAVDGNVATVRSGYLNCPPIMNGYFEVTVTVQDNSLTIDGPVINGAYKRD
jgi:hypothetical protein